MSATRLSDADYPVLRDYIRDICGLCITMDKKYLMEQRLADLLQDFGCADFAALAALVRDQPNASLRERIIDDITNSETYFFRDGHPFDSFATAILPELAQRMVRGRCAGGYQARIWSAGSSTGQEPYSLAMLVLDFASGGNGGGCSPENFQITATDVSLRSLSRAGKGVYSALEVGRGLPRRCLDTHFEPAGRSWAVRPELRRLVDFKRHNLIRSCRGLGPFDVIFCRNVLIYFDAETKKKVLADFLRLMPEHGRLILGGSESLYGLDSGFRSERVGETIVYQKA